MNGTNNKAVTLAQMIEAHKKSNAKTDALSNRVDQAAADSASALGAMYQQPKAAQYCTESNLTASGTGDITDETLGDLMGDKLRDDFAVKDDEGEFVLDGNSKKQYDFTLNDVTIGTYTEDSKLSQILADINSNDDAGVQVVYSQAAEDFTFTAKKAGADNKIELGDDLASAMFGIPTFAELCGLDIEEGAKQKVTFEFDDFNIDLNIKSDETMKSIATRITNNSGGQFNASYDETLGQIVATDHTGAPANFIVKNKDGVELTPNVAPTYTPGQDGIFTGVKVNGEMLDVTDGAVNIIVLTEQQVTDAINTRISRAYKIGGSVAFADLPELSEANMGLIVNVTNKFTTTADFVEGAGQKHPAGTNVAVIKVGETYMYDVMAGLVDLSSVVEKEEGKGLSSNDFTDEAKNKLDGIEFATDEEVAAALAEIYGEDEADGGDAE